METTQSIGKELSKIRKSKGISKYKIAKDAGISKDTVTWIEEGKNCTVGNLLNYLSAINMKIELKEE